MFSRTLGFQKIIILRFWVWYYTGAVKSLINIWRNFVIFVREYYSIPLLLRTLFYPWRRDITKYRRGFSFKTFFETLTFNLISRSLGFVIRSITVVIGLTVLELCVLNNCKTDRAITSNKKITMPINADLITTANHF